MNSRPARTPSANPDRRAIELNDVRRLLAKIRLALHVFFCGECTWVDTEREARRICQSSACRLAPSVTRAASDNRPLQPKRAMSFGEIVALSLMLPTFSGKEVALRIAVLGTELGAAKVAQATSIMIESLAHNPCTEHLRIELLHDGPTDGSVRHRSIWARVILAFKTLLRANVGFRDVRIRAPATFFAPSDEAELNSIAASSLDEVRLAVLMGTHGRVGARCMFGRMPQPLLEMIFEKSGLSTPCKVVVEDVGNGESRRHPGQDLNYIAEWVE
ncbi:hypothetical protein BSKO_13166 [Bryopsis sp. KO-2023]|nr:hypothetical protein BSKO_13166 [Bryopsis sp. KO-2023]